MAGWRAGAVAAAVFVVSCVVVDGGLGRGILRGDVGYYASIAGKVRGGAIPYHDFYLEYPPGAVAVFLVPDVLPGLSYVTWFNVLMAACGTGATFCSALILRQLGSGSAQTAFALGSISVSPLLVGRSCINRYDLLVALLLTATLALLLRDRLGGPPRRSRPRSSQGFFHCSSSRWSRYVSREETRHRALVSCGAHLRRAFSAVCSCRSVP
jgi:hypothetical protein